MRRPVAGENQVHGWPARLTAICDDCTLAVADNVADISRTKQFKFASEALGVAFAGVPDDQTGRDLAAISGTYARRRAKRRSTICSRPLRSGSLVFTNAHRYETLNLTRRLASMAKLRTA